MEPDPPLDYMLDQPPGPPAGRQELQAIVARSSRRRARITATGMAATLVIGGVVGWVVRPGRSAGGTPVATAGADTSTTVATPSALGAGGGVVTGGAGVAGGPVASPPFTFTKKFVRTTGDGVTIRAYQQGTTAPAGVNACAFAPGLMAEVSTADVAGAVGGGFSAATTAAPFVSVSANAIGVIEAAPVGVVTVRTDASVAQVRVTFADGKTDQMPPVDGWSVLAHLLPAAPAGQATLPTGTVQALDASGRVMASTALTSPLPKQVVPPVPAPAVPPPAVGRPVKTVPGKIGQAFKACPAPLIIPPPGIPAPKKTTIPAGTASTAVCGC